MKHAPKRDLPHDTTRTRGLGGSARPHRERVKLESGGTMANRATDEGREPKRPAFMMFAEDLADDVPAGVFGMYPAAFIPRILPWLGCKRSEVLHVCSGGLPPGEGIRVDIRPEAKPDILADGRKLPLDDNSIAAALLDPPYTEFYARELYGTEYPRPAHLLKEASRVVRPNGRIGFVHYIVPNPPPGCSVVKVFGLSMGFGYPMRAVTIFEKGQTSLFAEPALRQCEESK